MVKKILPILIGCFLAYSFSFGGPIGGGGGTNGGSISGLTTGNLPVAASSSTLGDSGITITSIFPTWDQAFYGSTRKAPMFGSGKDFPNFPDDTGTIAPFLLSSRANQTSGSVYEFGASLIVSAVNNSTVTFGEYNALYSQVAIPLNKGTVDDYNIGVNALVINEGGLSGLAYAIEADANIYGGVGTQAAGSTSFVNVNPSRNGQTYTYPQVDVFYGKTTINASAIITNLCGLHLEDITGGVNNYAIYTGAGKVHLGDLTASRLVATDASKNLVSTILLADLNTSISDADVAILGDNTFTGRQILSELGTDPTAANLTSGSNVQDRAAIYPKNDKLVIAVNRSGTVNYLTIPLDGSTTTWGWSTTAP